jgi:threonine aldolase
MVERGNLVMMAGGVIVATNQLYGTQTGRFGGVQLLVDIREEQDLRRRNAQLFSNIAIRLRFALRPHQGVEIAAEQMSNITFVAVAK